MSSSLALYTICIFFKKKLLLRHASFVKTVFYTTMSGWINLTYFFIHLAWTVHSKRSDTKRSKSTMTPWTLKTTVYVTNPFRSSRVHNSISDSTKYHGVLRLNLTANLTALFRRQFKCLLYVDTYTAIVHIVSSQSLRRPTSKQYRRKT